MEGRRLGGRRAGRRAEKHYEGNLQPQETYLRSWSLTHTRGQVSGSHAAQEYDGHAGKRVQRAEYHDGGEGQLQLIAW